VGAVYDLANRDSGADPEATLRSAAADTPVVAACMNGARAAGPVRYEADFSYHARSYSGPRWLLAGDSGCFLDPVFSTGVHFALLSGLEAADAVLAGTARARRTYDQVQRRRYRFFRRFARGFYDPGFRDLLFRPDVSRAIGRAVVSVLAGDDRPGPAARFFLRLFLGLTRVQRFIPLVPRLHGAVSATPSTWSPAHGG